MSANVNVNRSVPTPWFRMEDACVVSIGLSIVLALTAFYLSSTPIRIASVLLQLLVFAFMSASSGNKSLRNMSILIFAMCLPFAIFNSQSSEFRALIVPFCLLGGIGCAWFSLEFGKTFYTFELPFYCFLSITLYLFVGRGYGPAQFNVVFSGISRNGYSAILFSAECGYLISRSVRQLKPSVILAGLAFACSFPLYGRSSIVAIGMLLAASVMSRWPRLAVIVGIFSALTLVFGYVELTSIANLTNFVGGLESDRWGILDEYSSWLNPRTLLLGVPFGEVQAIQWNAGSPDMAFLRLHSYLGLAMFFLVFLFGASAVYLTKERRWLLVTVLFAVIFRAFTDVILLFGNIDLFFIPVLFFPYFAEYWKVSRPLSRLAT